MTAFKTADTSLSKWTLFILAYIEGTDILVPSHN